MPAMAVGLVIPLFLLGAGCAADAGDTEPSAGASSTSEVRERAISAERNETDLAYAHELSAMHEQAISLVAMISAKDISTESRDLGIALGRARATELEQLADLLRSWAVRPHGPDFHGNPGELSMDQLAALYELEGEEFERAWLSRLIDNHKGAVAMSRSEVDHGLSIEARELARRLVRVQQRDILELERLLG